MPPVGATLFADTHLINSLPFSRRLSEENPCTDRLQELCEEVLRLANEGGNEIIIRIGDWLDRSRPDAVAQERGAWVTRTLLSRGHIVIDIPGNHEVYSADATAFANDYQKWMGERIFVVHNGELPGMPGMYGYCFQPEQRLLRRLEQTPDKAGLFLHQTVKDARSGAWRSPVGIERESLSRFGFVLMGHFHEEQWWRDDQGYIAATIQHSPEDAGDESRGAYSVKIDGGALVSKTKLHAKTPRFYKRQVLSEAECQEWLDSIEDNAYVQAKIRAPTGELIASRAWRAKLKKVYERRFRHFAWHEHPIVERKKRLQLSHDDYNPNEPQKLSHEAIIAAYIASCDVTGLNKARLQQIAADALQSKEIQGNDQVDV